jgi:(4-O-methyl)-D-glucuronate---lignin esterase
VILGYNFQGNHTVHADPGISLAGGWLPPKAEGLLDGKATDASRGAQAGRWSVEYLLSRGYALATIYYGDVEPDHFSGWRAGIRSHLRPSGRRQSPAKSTGINDSPAAMLWEPADAAPTDWGAIAAWAWGLSRAMDYLETDADLNPRQVVVFGHSRLGKTSLWAGAQDERFAIVISNDSGEGGAALARREFGERTENLNKNFPHWFCGNFKQYSGHEDKLPVDAHELLALCAPRPLYVASAIDDRWADPRGEFLAALAAEPAYRLFGLPGLGVSAWPPVDTPVGQTIGYHVRTGKHDVLPYDWTQYLNFADRHFGRK